MLKFTSLLSDEFRQSSSFSSLQKYHQSKKNTTLQPHQYPKQSIISFGKHSWLSHYPSTNNQASTIRRGHSYSDISQTNNFRNHPQSNNIQDKYLRQHGKNQYSGHQNTVLKNRVNSVGFTGLNTAEDRSQTKNQSNKMGAFCEVHENCDPIFEKRLGKWDKNNIRETGQPKMRISRLNNLESIQKKIQATLNVRKKLMI